GGTMQTSVRHCEKQTSRDTNPPRIRSVRISPTTLPYPSLPSSMRGRSVFAARSTNSPGTLVGRSIAEETPTEGTEDDGYIPRITGRLEGKREDHSLRNGQPRTRRRRPHGHVVHAWGAHPSGR